MPQYEYIEHPTPPYNVSSLFCDSRLLSYTGTIHYHNSYELFYLLSGKRTYLRHTTIFPLEADCITLTRPHTLHSTAGGPYQRYCIHFTKEFLTEYFNEQYIDELLQTFTRDMLPKSLIHPQPRIKELFRLIHDYTEKKQFPFVAHMLGEVLFLLRDTSQKLPLNHQHQQSEIIRSVCEYISNNFKSPITLSELSTQFHFSKFYLSHLFKAATGFTLSEYLIATRLNNALYLLQYTQDTVQDIALKCGYDDTAHFCHSFKKKFAVTPSEHRNKFKQSK